MVCQLSGFIIQRHKELRELCHPNADSYRDLTPMQIYKKHENEKKRQYAEREMEIEQGTFTPLVFTTTSGMADKCVKYLSRPTEVIANKK